MCLQPSEVFFLGIMAIYDAAVDRILKHVITVCNQKSPELGIDTPLSSSLDGEVEKYQQAHEFSSGHWLCRALVRPLTHVRQARSRMEVQGIALPQEWHFRRFGLGSP